MRWRGWLGSLVLLVLVALVIFGNGDDERPAGPGPGSGAGTRASEPDAGPGHGGGRSVFATVVRVVDGDTVEVSIGGTEDDVRYIGIDTPETVKPGEPVQCFGPQASALNHRLVEGRRVRLVFDAERRDVYGRLLAYVYLGRRFVNAELVRRGFARTLTIVPNDTHAALFARLQRSAGRAGLGLWRACSP
jgi:micrococcal nuclease